MTSNTKALLTCELTSKLIRLRNAQEKTRLFDVRTNIDPVPFNALAPSTKWIVKGVDLICGEVTLTVPTIEKAIWVLSGGFWRCIFALLVWDFKVDQPTLTDSLNKPNNGLQP